MFIDTTQHWLHRWRSIHRSVNVDQLKNWCTEKKLTVYSGLNCYFKAITANTVDTLKPIKKYFFNASIDISVSMIHHPALAQGLSELKVKYSAVPDARSCQSNPSMFYVDPKAQPFFSLRHSPGPLRSTTRWQAWKTAVLESNKVF